MKTIIRKEWTEAADALVLIVALLFGSRIPIGFLEKATSLPFDLLMIVLGIYTLRGLLRRVRHYGLRIFREDSRLFIAFLSVLLFWWVYGCAGLLLSPYTSLGEGFQSVYYLTMAICAMFCTYDYCSTARRTKIFLTVLGIICGAMVLLALAESFVGYHLPQSKYINPKPIQHGTHLLPGGLLSAKLVPATLLEYNPNDLSALIAIVLPSLYVTGSEKFGGKCLKTLLVLAALYGMIVNDANLAIIGMLASVLVYTVLLRRQWRSTLATAVGSVVLVGGAAEYITRMLKALKTHLWGSATSASTAGSLAAAANTVTLQVQAHSTTSRWRLILDAWDMAVTTRFLGVGPRGYRWFETFGQRTKFVDPHCWYMEVLSQYGILVFVSYFGSIVYMYVRMIMAQWKNRSALFAQVIAMCTAFVFACVAPSTFTKATYAWILPALCLSLLRLDTTEPNA